MEEYPQSEAAHAERCRPADLRPAAGRAYLPRMPISAIVTAGDGQASKLVYGDNKVYLEVGGRALVARVVEVLQWVPEVSEVWVVGDHKRLEEVFDRKENRENLCKPLYIVPQFRNLYENIWQTYRRLLPDAGNAGRDCGPVPSGSA